MRYYYVPSTYRGKRFGTGIRGGALRGYGSIVGGTLIGGFTSLKVDPAEVSQAVVGEATPAQAEEIQDKIATAEATGKPVSIGKRLFNVIGSVVRAGINTYQSLNPTSKALLAIAATQGASKFIASPTGQAMIQKGINGVKAIPGLLSAAKTKVPEMYDAAKIKVIDTLHPKPKYVPNILYKHFRPSLSDVTVKPIMNMLKPKPKPSLVNRLAKAAMFTTAPQQKSSKIPKFFSTIKSKLGFGYGAGKGRLRKGSPEAKAYMARLRAMRGRRRGKKGGMFKGVNHERLAAAVAKAQRLNRTEIRMTDAYGDTHIVPLENAEAMVEGYSKMRNFWKDKDCGEYIREHYLTGNTHKLWNRMTSARMRMILRRIRNGTLPRRFMARRASADFLKTWLDFSRGGKGNSKANKLATMLATIALTNSCGSTRKLEPDVLNSYNKYLDRMIPHKRRGKRLANEPPPPQSEPIIDAEPSDSESPAV